MTRITVKTNKKDEVVDITNKIAVLLLEQERQDGLCTIFVAHTTCCITTADLDPGTDLDFLDFLRKIEPKLTYRHPHDPKHAPDHILSSIIGPSVTVPFENKHLILGDWQRIILIELDGPRERKLIVSFL
ncbi:MAG: YjbQ family protein [Candidatus Levybacteria bacterium]|nr:YjbQ family protein [Candidatus Levybacteria bacterium]